MSVTKGKWKIMAGAPWNILNEGGARIVWCRSEDSRSGEPADIANARHIVDLHNADEALGIRMTAARTWALRWLYKAGEGVSEYQLEKDADEIAEAEAFFRQVQDDARR